MHDNLTGLPNRELFFDRLEAALTYAQNDPRLRPTVFCIDIDRFKQINETVGLSAGDSILLTLSRRLSRLLKPQDTIARISGDKYAAILVSENDSEQTIQLANVVRRALSTPVTFADREIPLTASIGLALFDPQLHPRREDMLKDAEIAMRHAKKGGGNRIEVFRPAMRTLRSDRVALESDLRKALERGEIKVFFQPVVRLEDRTVAGFESLLRWDNPRLGRLSPAEFIPIAEETGAIVDLGNLRPRADRARAGRMAARARCRPADLRLRQRVLAPVAAPRPAARREGRSDALRRRARLAEARADREPRDGKPGICRADPDPHPRARRRALPR